MAGGAQERLVLVLAVDLDQGFAELLQEREGGVGVVEEHASAPPAHELPPHHELAVLERDAVFVQQRRHRALPRCVEHRLDGSGLGAGADGLGRLGPLAEEEREGVDQD